MRINILCLFSLLLVGCTDNVRAKGWGGTMKMDLPPNEKLVNVTWKEANMWYLTRPMKDGEEAETYSFRESSNFGLLEGTVNIIEHKEKQ